MPASAARRLAASLLSAIEGQGARAGEWMQGDEPRRCSPRDRALAFELALGVLRHRTELDWMAQAAAGRPVRGLAPIARTALRLGIYQLRYLDRVPAVAAVHESVELAKAAGARAAGFVNAVLRRATALEAPLETLLAAETDPLRRREIRFSHPGWLLARWQRRWGEAAAETIAAFDNEVPQPSLRPSGPALRDPSQAEGLWRELAAAGVTLAPGRLLTAARRVQAGAITDAAPFLSGRVALQDEASQLMAYLLLPGASGRVLDVCAAPGGKTAILAALAPPSTRLLALDRSWPRAAAMRARLPPAVAVTVADAERPLPVPGGWDRILVDAPCSGTGTLQRNPEIRWRLRPEELERFAARQKRILDQALAALAPGGRLLYCVCSIEEEEGEQVVRGALASHAGLRLEDTADLLQNMEAAGWLIAGAAAQLVAGPFLEIRPGQFATEGFFAAVLTRAGARRSASARPKLRSSAP